MLNCRQVIILDLFTRLLVEELLLMPIFPMLGYSGPWWFQVNLARNRSKAKYREAAAIMFLMDWQHYVVGTWGWQWSVEERVRSADHQSPQINCGLTLELIICKAWLPSRSLLSTCQKSQLGREDTVSTLHADSITDLFLTSCTSFKEE